LVCQEVVKTLDSELVANATEAEVEVVLKAVCPYLPITNTQNCQDFIDTNIPVVMKLLANGLLTPDYICTDLLHLCSATSLSAAQAPLRTANDNCATCELIVDFLINELKDNKTDEAIVEALEKVCRVVPVDAATCKDFVDTYAAMVIKMILDNSTPAQICSAIGLCGQMKVKADDQKCQLCLIVANVVEAELNNQKTQEEIVKLVQHACSLMPANDKQTCLNMVDTYTGYLISLIESMESPESVCEMISFCPTPPTNLECEICTYAASYLESEVANGKTEEEIENLLGKVCDLLPNMDTSLCKQTVDQLTDMIIQMMQMVPPRNICEEIKLCPVSQKPKAKVSIP